MSFASGSVSFRRFAVVGKHPKSPDDDILKSLKKHILKPTEYGAPDEVEYGWSGGRHLFDAKFSFEHNVFNDALHFALRLDTNKVPGVLKKAYQIIEEETLAAKNPSGHISKKQKKDVKEIVRQKLDEDLKSGRFRRSKLVPMLWDFDRRELYASIAGPALEKLHELFERSFDLQLEPLTAGALALRHLEKSGKRREYEDTRPTRFVPGPEGEGQMPDYPWVAKGPQPKDFFGNEFMLWLWHAAERDAGVIATDKSGDVSLVLDKSLELDCAYGISGRDTLRGDGPTRMPEARDALRSGKVPRKLNLILESSGRQFELSLSAETLALSAAKLPDVEKADDTRVIFEERVSMIRDLCSALDALFAAFLKLRASSSWESQTTSIRKWIMHPLKAGAAA
jgi:hypothetical protein